MTTREYLEGRISSLKEIQAILNTGENIIYDHETIEEEIEHYEALLRRAKKDEEW